MRYSEIRLWSYILISNFLLWVAAFVNACVYLQIEPVQKFNVSFVSGSENDHCMIYGGRNATLEVSRAGFSCVSVGYVEKKGQLSPGDVCQTDESVWGLSYHGGVYSGSTLSYWTSGSFFNEIQLFDADAGTHVCDWKSLCLMSGLRWDKGTLGPIFVSTPLRFPVRGGVIMK